MDKRKYSILIVAFECHYSHVERFIKFLKYVNPHVVISLFADEHAISDTIRKNVSNIIYKKRVSESRPIKNRVLSVFLNKVVLIKQIRELSSTVKFDIINIHFTQYYMCFVMRYLRKMSKAIILTPWGSDILRVHSKFKLILLKRAYRKADLVTVGPRGPIGNIISNVFKVDKNRMIPLAWGSETIDYINDHLDSISQREAQRRLGLDNKYIITCGYNAFPEQRHMDIIDAVEKVKSILPNNIVLLFPVTYGTESRKGEYIGVLKRRCQELNLPAVFYEHYLSVEDTYLLRRASDMFIHVQTTDAGNSTIMEYCICGSKIIHGSWLHYKWLDYPPLFYYPVKKMEDLPTTISEAYFSEPPLLPKEVVSIIRNRGWKQKMVAWNAAFVSCLSE